MSQRRKRASSNAKSSSSLTSSSDAASDEELKALQTVRVTLKGVSVMLDALQRDVEAVADQLDTLSQTNSNWAQLFGDHRPCWYV
jgi:flagellin-like hook-associated protein FlgL